MKNIDNNELLKDYKDMGDVEFYEKYIEYFKGEDGLGFLKYVVEVITEK